MKIAVTATGTDLSSNVDPRFGRAQYFLIVDTESGEDTVIDNQASMDLSRGAGIQSAESLAKNSVEVLLTGHCGPNAFQTLSAAGIKVIVGVEGTVNDAVERFKKGEYEFTDSADVTNHW